jgi:hypothetical protein
MTPIFAKLPPILIRIAQIAQQLDDEGLPAESSQLDDAAVALGGEAATNTGPTSAFVGSVLEHLERGGLKPEQLLSHEGVEAVRAEMIRALNMASRSAGNYTAAPTGQSPLSQKPQTPAS